MEDHYPATHKGSLKIEFTRQDMTRPFALRHFYRMIHRVSPLEGEIMETYELSTCFCTDDVRACIGFYQKYFSAKIIFDCGWYVNMSIDGDGPTIQFMKPQGEMPKFGGVGVTLNFMVNNVDAECERLLEAGLKTVMPLEDHPWGDRGFSVTDPIGTSIYIYSEREPSEEFRQYYKGQKANAPEA